MLIDITDPSENKKKQPIKPAVGIDLGTTRSLIALQKKDFPVKILPQSNGKNFLHSAVTFRNDRLTPTDNLVNSITSFKRFIGKSSKDFAKSYIENRKFSNIENGKIKLVHKDKSFSAVELSAAILQKLMKSIPKVTDTAITDAVITVPAYFDDAARAETLQAARLAGINVLRLLNEPTAAALAYGLDKKVQGTYLIYDLGGGTFDISLLKMNDGVFKVIATNGNTTLGGDDFDQNIAHFIVDQLPKVMQVQIDKDPSLWDIILNEARTAKIDLSKTDHVDIEIIFESIKHKISMSRREFEKINRPLINETISLTRKTIKAADVPVEQVDGIVLIGGSTRVPAIKECLSSSFDIKIFDDINPDEAVAVGAAIQAYNLTHESDQLLVDVNPLSLGIEVMGGLNDKIIERNTSIPTSVKKEFTTYADGQTGMKFHIVQGERELAKDCRSLCNFEITNLPPMMAGLIKVEVLFSIDSNGVLSITAEDRTHNILKEVEINPAYGVDDSQINQMLDDSLKYAREDVTAKLLAESIVSAQQVIDHLQKFIKHDQELLSKQELDAINSQINKLGESISQKNRNQIDKNLELLEKVTEGFVQKRMNKYLASQLEGKEVSSVEKTLSKKK